MAGAPVGAEVDAEVDAVDFIGGKKMSSSTSGGAGREDSEVLERPVAVPVEEETLVREVVFFGFGGVGLLFLGGALGALVPRVTSRGTPHSSQTATDPRL